MTHELSGIERFQDPGLPEHHHRKSDTDAIAANRAERQVAILFLLSAIGTIGTAAAMENADIVLLSDSLEPVVWAIRLARAVRRTIRINLTISIGAIAIMSVLTLVGSRLGWHVPLSVGVLAHEGGTVLVVANSLLLLRFRRA